MESKSASADPHDDGADLALADAMRARLADGLRLPSAFHSSIGAIVTVQIAATAVGISRSSTWPGVTVLIAGLVAFAVVAGWQLVRFRRLNGVWLGGLASRAVLGTSSLSSVVYAAGLAAACWAALAGAWWLTVAAAVLGGVGYAISGQRWWAAYQREPANHARGESRVYVAAVVMVALGALVALLAASR